MITWLRYHCWCQYTDTMMTLLVLWLMQLHESHQWVMVSALALLKVLCQCGSVKLYFFAVIFINRVAEQTYANDWLRVCQSLVNSGRGNQACVCVYNYTMIVMYESEPCVGKESMLFLRGRGRGGLILGLLNCCTCIYFKLFFFYYEMFWT